MERMVSRLTGTLVCVCLLALGGASAASARNSVHGAAARQQKLQSLFSSGAVPSQATEDNHVPDSDEAAISGAYDFERTAPAQTATSVATETAAPIPVSSVAATQPSPSVSPEDELLARLRERRITASNSERPQIVEAFAKIERKYPRDYRFPYERAKLVAKGTQSSSRDEAFKALSVAAERAISNGKASEMLSGLETDKTGDFHRLAQGRQEWLRLVAALKRKDTSLLLTKTQFQ